MGKQHFFKSVRALLMHRLATGAPPFCIQIKRCFGSSAVYLHVLTGDLPVTLRSTIPEAPSRLELSGSFLWIGGAASLRTAQEMTQVF